MKFHDVHGVNVSLDDSKRVAKRTNSFCDAFVFSSNPLLLNSSTVIKLSPSQQSSSEWHGTCFLGLTSRNPISFIESIYSKHIINLLTANAEDVWIKQVSPSWSNASLILSLNSDGQLEIITEYDLSLKYVFLENLPVNFPLWLIIDLYGQTDQVQFPQYSSPNSREIVSLGSDVYSTYKCGENGVVPYNSARIILIGPKSSGKSQLKNTFISNLNQESKDYDGTDSYNYHLCTNNGGDWTLVSNQLAQKKVKISDPDKSNIYHEIAKNIVHEIVLMSNQEQLDSSDSLSPKDLIKNVLKFPRKLLRPYSKEVKQLSENVNEIPDELMLMIEEMLKTVPNDQKSIGGTPSGNVGQSSVNDHSGTEPKQKYIINVSDFSGNLLYLLINQFFFTSCAVYLFVFNLADDLESTNLAKHENLSCICELGNQSLTVLRSIHLWISLIHSTIAGFPIPNEEPIVNETSNDQQETTATAAKQKLDLQPQVVLVGTHRNSIHAEPITRNQIIKEIFDKIHSSFKDTSYGGHLYEKYIALDCKEMSFDEPDLVQNLRQLIESLIRNERMTGFSIPLCWMQLEQMLEKFKQRGIYFVDIYQLYEVVSSQIESFQSYENLNSALYFYHNQGKIFYLDCVNQSGLLSNERHGTCELGIIILDPNWFIQCIYELFAYLCAMKNDDDNLFLGIISENAINNAWSNFIDQKFILLGCLENLDLICELNPYLPMEDTPDIAATAVVPKLYFFPWITKSMLTETTEFVGRNGNSSNQDDSEGGGSERDSSCDSSPINQLSVTNGHNSPSGTGTNVENTTFNESTFQFVIHFNILPVSLFTRLLIRLSKWSWNQGWGRKPEMFNSKGRIAVDFDHDIILKIDLFRGRIYLITVKIFEELPNDQIENVFVGPAANVCVKVQHLIENELASLKNTYYRRLSFKLVIPCPCDAICDQHKIEGCLDESCLHFLNLQECLQKKVVECQYNRQVRTTFIQRFLPYASSNINNDILYDTRFTPIPNTTNIWENVFQVEQLWMRKAAKLLNGTTQSHNHHHHHNHNHSSSSLSSNSDWVALAKRLSYTERDIMKFNSELSPSLALLKDWYESNGRTRYCIDVLVSCLRMLSREDIAALIEYELEPESVSPPIFLSYQHDSQKQVLEIRRKLELSGFPCWMDIRSISGGDSLYGKIYEGISRAKVFICCLTPRYVASPMCNREVALADVLHKPILPLIIEFIPWPPPGAMALIMSSIVYVDLCGVGSHHGTGRSQDTESCFHEILDHISRYISGYSDSIPFVSSQSYHLQLPDLFSSNSNNPGRGGLGGDGDHHYGGYHSRNLLVNHRPQPHHYRNLLHHNLGNRHRHQQSERENSQLNQFNRIQSSSATSMLLRRNSQDSQSLRPMLMESDLEQIIRGGIGSSNNGGNGHNVAGQTTTSNQQQQSSSILNNITQPMPRDADLPFSDEIITDDNISVITRTRIANRITNCSVCIII